MELEDSASEFIFFFIGGNGGSTSGGTISRGEGPSIGEQHQNLRSSLKTCAALRAAHRNGRLQTARYSARSPDWLAFTADDAGLRHSRAWAAPQNPPPETRSTTGTCTPDPRSPRARRNFPPTRMRWARCSIGSSTSMEGPTTSIWRITSTSRASYLSCWGGIYPAHVN